MTTKRSRKPKMVKAEEPIIESGKEIEPLAGEIVDPEDIQKIDQDISFENSLLAVTRGSTVSNAHTLVALEAVESGKLPPSGIATREGPNNKQVAYVKHTWATRTMNAAFRWLWDYEVLDYHVDPHDGSVAARCQMTIHIPLQNAKTGEITFHERRITEIGSAEAFFTKGEYPDGAPRFTMPTSDRIASAASRGLVKCVLRAFNLGLELSEKENDNTPVTNKDAWNALLRYGRNQGLTRDQIVSLMKGKISGDEIAVRFGEAYRMIHNFAKGRVDEEVPNL